jgi:hypothetical protein
VQAAHYPPIGRRGLATTTRAGRHSFSNLKEHLRSAQENTLIAVQIEDPEAIEHVEEIASVPYIDCVFIGPSDLSLGLGSQESDHPTVVAAFDGYAKRWPFSEPQARQLDGTPRRAWTPKAHHSWRLPRRYPLPKFRESGRAYFNMTGPGFQA